MLMMSDDWEWTVLLWCRVTRTGCLHKIIIPCNKHYRIKPSIKSWGYTLKLLVASVFIFVPLVIDSKPGHDRKRISDEAGDGTCYMSNLIMCLIRGRFRVSHWPTKTKRVPFTASATHQNQRKMKIFSLRMLRGMTQRVVCSSASPSAPNWW